MSTLRLILYIPQIRPIVWPILIAMLTILLISTMSSIMKISNNERIKEKKVSKTKKRWKW